MWERAGSRMRWFAGTCGDWPTAFASKPAPTLLNYVTPWRVLSPIPLLPDA